MGACAWRAGVHHTIDQVEEYKVGKKKVELPGVCGNWALEMETIRDMETLDGDALEYGGDDMGCEECGAPGSSIRLELQKTHSQMSLLREELRSSVTLPDKGFF